MTPEEIAAIIAHANAGGTPPPAAPPVVPAPPVAPPVVPAQPAAAAPSVAPPVVPPVAAVPPVPAMPPAAPAAITLTPEQWAAYTSTQGRIAELEAAEAARAREAAAAEVRSLQARGQIEQAFALQRQQAEAALTTERTRLAEVEGRARRYALDGELARALAAFPLVPGGAEQITTLIRDEFTVEGQGDTFVVRSKDFRTVADYVAAVMATKYPHFVRATNPAGGTAGTQGTQAAPTGPGQTVPIPGPANMSEAVIAQYRSQNPAGANPALTGGAVIGEDGRQIPRPAAGFGLKPVVKSA